MRRSYKGIYYDPQDPDNLRLFVERQSFLRAAGQNVNGFLESLHRETGQFLDRWLKDRKFPGTSSGDLYREFYDALHQVVIVWSERFNIYSAWVINEATHEALTFYFDKRQTLGDYWRTLDPCNRSHVITVPDWDPFNELERAYRQRHDAAARLARDAHVATVKAQLVSEGKLPIQAPRNRGVPPEIRHVLAALFQCGGVEFSDLEADYHDQIGVEDVEGAITRHVIEVLATIGITPRPPANT